MRDRILLWIAWHLISHRLAYWVVIRVAGNASVGDYSRQDVTTLNVQDMLERWVEKPK